MAGVRFSGDSQKLVALIGRFEELSTKRWREKLNRKLAEEALHLAHEGFEKSRNPYGEKWKKLKYRNGQPLRLTGRLEASIRPVSSAERFVLETNVVYSATHEFGRGPIPQRQFLPIGARGFGGTWRRALFAVVSKHVHDALRR